MQTCLDVFSGCGGMSHGLTKAGFVPIGAVDCWNAALRTFAANHVGVPTIDGDLSAIEPRELRKRLGLSRGELTVLVGGPPCQGFSKNVPATYRFLEDPRNQLYKNFLALLEEFEPRAAVMENVAELFNAYGGSVRDEVIARMNSLGYRVAAQVVHAEDYGVPQKRRRSFFLAIKTRRKFEFPPPTHSRANVFVPSFTTAWEAISDLPSLKNGEGTDPCEYASAPQNAFQKSMREGSSVVHNHVTRELREKQFERVSALGPGQGLKDLPVHLQTKGGYSGAYGRLDFENVAPTITRWVFHPGSGRFCHPKDDRLITIREAGRLQSFFDDFRFLGTYIEQAHQVGNAVPPLIMKTIGEFITSVIGRDSPTSVSTLHGRPSDVVPTQT